MGISGPAQGLLEGSKGLLIRPDRLVESDEAVEQLGQTMDGSVPKLYARLCSQRSQVCAWCVDVLMCGEL